MSSPPPAKRLRQQEKSAAEKLLFGNGIQSCSNSRLEQWDDELEAVLLFFFYANGEQQNPLHVDGELGLYTEKIGACVEAVNKKAGHRRTVVVAVSLDDPQNEQDVKDYQDFSRESLDGTWHRVPLRAVTVEGVEGVSIAESLGELCQIEPHPAQLPALVVLGRGKTITNSERVLSRIMADPVTAAAAFPFEPPTLKDALQRGGFVDSAGKEISPERLQASQEIKYIGILSAYHSKIDEEATEYVDKLKEAYEAVRRSSAPAVFEVLFVPQNMPSPSPNEEENRGYLAMLGDYQEFRQTMPWLSVSLSDTEMALDLTEACEIDPEAERTLRMVAVHPTGEVEVLHKQAMGLMAREGASGFPWKRPPSQDIDQAAEEDPSCLQSETANTIVVLTPGTEADEATRAEIDTIASTTQEALWFYHGGLKSEMGQFLLNDVLDQPEEAKGKGCMLALAIAAQPPSYLRLPEGTAQGSLAAFLKLYHSGGLEKVLIKTPESEGDEEEEEQDEEEEEQDAHQNAEGSC